MKQGFTSSFCRYAIRTVLGCTYFTFHMFIYLDSFTPSSVRIIFILSAVCFVLSHFWAPPSLSNVRLMSTAPPRADLAWGPSNTGGRNGTQDQLLALCGRGNRDLNHYRGHFTRLIIICLLHAAQSRTGWRPLFRPEVGDQLSSELCQLCEAILRPGCLDITRY